MAYGHTPKSSPVQSSPDRAKNLSFLVLSSGTHTASQPMNIIFEGWGMGGHI